MLSWSSILIWAISVLDLRSEDTPKSSVACEIGNVTVESSVDSIMKRVQPQVIIHAAGLVPELAERYGRKEEARVLYCHGRYETWVRKHR